MNQKLHRQNYISDPYQGYPPQQQGKDGYPYPSQGYPPQGYPSSQGYPPSVGFVNPGYPSGPQQSSGFSPLVPPPNNPYGHSPNIPPQHPGGYIDPEDLTEIKGFDFSEETIRRGFIRKVYSILSVSGNSVECIVVGDRVCVLKGVNFVEIKHQGIL